MRALHVAGHQLAVARLARQLGQLARDLEQPLLVGVLDHRHDQPAGRVGREADVVVALQDQVLAVERRVEVRERLQRRHRRDDQERHHRDLDPVARVLVVELLAPRLELGDVGLVVVRDVRDHHPVAGQDSAPRSAGSASAARARSRRTSRSRSTATAADRGPDRDRRPRGSRRGAGAPPGRARRSLDVLLGDPALAAAAGHRGAGRRRARARPGGPPGSRRRGLRRCPPEPAAPGLGAVRGAGGAACSSACGRAVDRHRPPRLPRPASARRPARRRLAGAPPSPSPDGDSVSSGVALGNLVPDLHEQLAHGPRERRRHVHRRLVGLERQQRVVDRDRVARRDQDLDDRDVGRSRRCPGPRPMTAPEVALIRSSASGPRGRSRSARSPPARARRRPRPRRRAPSARPPRRSGGRPRRTAAAPLRESLRPKPSVPSTR